ncbi:MAG: hypothetical protein E7600_02000 [Ruminococcaceae bacterium]|nr:hypothetical protein [Oscillospiraceae bacterium]
MSFTNGMDKTSSVMTKGKEKIKSFCSFVDGLTVKNKANFDIQLKSDKSFTPICKHSFGYNKEIKLKHIIIALSVLAAVAAMLGAFRKKD